ncbi:MAG: hypothetical protein ABIO70_28245 [Pseudomonadota bacterium]
MRSFALHLTGLAAVFAVGCFSNLTGNEGNFQFSYQADDWITDFNKPIAPGAYLDLTVREVGTLIAVDLTAASYDDDTVMTVDSFDGNSITVQGVGDGTALLSVEGTTSSGETLTDSVNMLCATPEVLVLGHTCDTAREAAYLTDQRVYLPFELQRSNGQPVIGYGYYPLTLDSEAMSMAPAESNQQWIAFDTASVAGTVVLSSDIDDTTLTADVISPDMIDDVQEPIAFVAEDIDVGDVNAFFVRPMAGGLVVCQPDVDKTVASLTPEICAVRDTGTQPNANYEYGWFEIEGVAEGTCLYSVTYPDGAGGEGVTAEFSYPIEP